MIFFGNAIANVVAMKYPVYSDSDIPTHNFENYVSYFFLQIHGVISASEARGNVSDGYFTCAFSWKTTALGTVDSPDLTNPEGHYLLMAVGPANSIRKHRRIPSDVNVQHWNDRVVIWLFRRNFRRLHRKLSFWQLSVFAVGDFHEHVYRNP